MKTVFASALAAMLLLSALLLSALLLAACAGMGSRQAGEAVAGAGNSVLADEICDGTYEGTAQGYRGVIHVRLRIDNGFMTEVEILDSREDRFVGGAAIDDLVELALLYNTADLDAISGATESSEGFLAALSSALESARCQEPDL